jgi:hypothetical protein
LGADPGPLPKGVDTGSLNAVAVISPNDVWAVGSTFGRILPWDPFAVHWDGAAWHRVPVGRPRLRGSLEGLGVIPGTGQLWTVGYRSDTTRHTLILRWDGEAWHRVRSPDPSDHGNLLNDVVAVGDVAWAVGVRYGPDTESTLMERWDGSAWKVVHAPNPGRTRPP